MYNLSEKVLENFVLDADYIKEGKGVTATRRIFKNTEYDIFEKTKLSQFKEHLEQGMVEYMHDAQGDDLLLRFLYANSFDEEAAKQQFVNHLYWLDKWLAQESHVDTSRYDKIISIGERDFMHRPVLKINLEHINNKENPNAFLSALIKKMIEIEEEMFVPGLIEQKIVVIYPSKIDVSVDVIKDFISITTTNFPCSMDLLYVIEPNPICQYLLDHLIDQDKLNSTLQKKIRFVTKQQFMEQFTSNKPPELVQTTKLSRQPTKSMTMMLPGQLQTQTFQLQKLENEQKSLKSEPKDEPPDPELHNCNTCTKREKLVPNLPQKQSPDQLDYYDSQYNKPYGVYPLLVYAYGYPVKVENAETLMRQEQIVTPQIFDASHLSRLEYSPYRQEMKTTNEQLYQKDEQFNQKDQLHETQVQKVNLEHSQTRLGRNKYDDIIEQYNWDKYGGMPYYPTKFDLHREELNLVDQQPIQTNITQPIKTNQSQPPLSQLPSQNNGSQYNFPPQNQNQTQTHFNYSNMPSQEFNYPKQQFQEPSIKSLQENRSVNAFNIPNKSNNNIAYEPFEYVIPTNQSNLQKDPSPISNQAYNYQPYIHQQQPSNSYIQPIKIEKLATFDKSNNFQSNQYTSIQTPKLPSVYNEPSYNTKFNFGALPQRPPDPSPSPIQFNYEVHPFQESERIPTVPVDQSAVIKHQDETVIVQDHNTSTQQQLHNNKNCIIF